MTDFTMLLERCSYNIANQTNINLINVSANLTLMFSEPTLN